ncbi:FKBP-type peptidyl-prolyl cis-trans isomerase [Cyclobacterium sp.]|uniref:FKBP-type peptidyl-prolyl cis-trans isomerase n=1 Tax=Cyclobacterium sp. TaxID=1966343 RepID=UPI0019A09B78|nr:FKBP-type peptidyl-prolyl cis-trans isomerase [Cyclobacterium sp.]MBD3630651.1 FKBP-type peptidyl-prolyl cis-trans isomerase [Cyclobacterium sp.]
MKKINNLVLGVLLVSSGLLFSCEKTQTTSDGIEYKYINQGDQETKDGEFVVYHFTAKTGSDSLFISSYDQPVPPYLQHLDSAEAKTGIDEIFLNLNNGDSIVITSTAEKIFLENVPPFLENDETVTISIGVLNVLEEEVFEDYFNDLVAEQQKKQSEQAGVQLDEDVQTIESYIQENNLDASKTASGLYYVIEEEGSGPQVEQGDKISVNYTGYVLDGTVFDTSIESKAKEANTYDENRPYEPFTFDVGQGMVIPGWDEGLQLLKEGAKAKFLIPSPLAYGPSQRGAIIVPNSILIFDVEVTDVEKQ